MPALLMLYTGSVVTVAWGIAHIIPTKQVVAGFEPQTPDNRRVLTMEWVAEGWALCFIGLLTLLLTLSGMRFSEAAVLVYRASAVMLLLMAIWTGVTGARTSVIFFKICPVVKSACAVLLLAGSSL